MDDHVDLPRSPLRSPDAAKRLAGLSLPEAFLKFVIQDAGLAATSGPLLAKIRKDSPFVETLRDGSYPNFTGSPRWPTKYEDIDLAAAANRTAFLDLDREPSPAEIALSDIVLDRYGAFIDLLRRGDVIAIGTFPATGQRVEISPREWSRKGLNIDVENGDVVESTSEGYATRWTGVELMSRDASTPDNGAAKSKGGRDPKYAWDDVIDELVLYVATKGLPESQGELKRWIQKAAAHADGTEPDESTVRDFLNRRLPKTKAKVAARER